MVAGDVVGEDWEGGDGEGDDGGDGVVVVQLLEGLGGGE